MCPSRQVSFCVALPKDESCNLACDSNCDPKCPEGSHPVVIDCKTMCLEAVKKVKSRNVCEGKFEHFICAQEASINGPATRCECPTTTATVQAADDINDLSASASGDEFNFFGDEAFPYSNDERDFGDESDFRSVRSDSYSHSRDASDFDYPFGLGDGSRSDYSHLSHSSDEFDSRYNSYSTSTNESDFGGDNTFLSSGDERSGSDSYHYRLPRRHRYSRMGSRRDRRRVRPQMAWMH